MTAGVQAPKAAELQLPDLPGELCGIWAYIQWEEAGCPNRSSADSDAEYQKSIEARAQSQSCSLEADLLCCACCLHIPVC